MAITQVQKKSGVFRDAVPALTFDTAPVQGNLLVAVVGGRSAAATGSFTPNSSF